MAVHPADDGELVIDDSPRKAVSTLTVLIGLFIAVIVASAVVVGYGLLRDGQDAAGAGPDGQAAREAVMSQADQFILRANTYGPADLDENNELPAYADRVREVISPKFQVSFDDNLTLAEQTVAQSGYARDIDLYATAVETADSDNATVLVAGVLTGSSPDSSAEAKDGDRVEFEPQPFRYKIMLVRIEGEWLVDDFSPLTSELVDPSGSSTETDPGADPSSSPSPESSGQPEPPSDDQQSGTG